MSDTLSYKPSDSLLLRGENTSCVFQQQEAGVTPEARRDRAAILRRDGVAPAQFSDLAAYKVNHWNHWTLLPVLTYSAFGKISVSQERRNNLIATILSQDLLRF